MKTIVILFTLLGISLSALADRPEYTCPQNFEFTPLAPGATTKTVVVIHNTNSPRYKAVTVFDETISTGRRTQVLQDLFSASSEDVLYDLRGRNAFIRIYLDELDQSYIKLGRKTIHLNCR